MKHLKPATRVPARADLDHPGLLESIGGFIVAPFRTLALHIEYIYDKTRY